MVYREIFTVLFWPLLSVNDFKTGRIPTSQIISLKTQVTQLCLGQFNMGGK